MPDQNTPHVGDTIPAGATVGRKVGDAIPSGATVGLTPQQALLADPEFQKLSPEAQHIVIGKRFPEYASLSPEAQKIVLSKAAPAEHKITFGIPLGFGQSQEVSMTPEELQQFQKQGKRDVVLGAGMAASMVGG